MTRVLSKRAFALAWSTLRGRPAGFVAAFVAVLCGSAVITLCGVLLETGLRSGVPTERYQAAAVVVGAEQTFPVADDANPRYSERVRLPAARVDEVAQVPGVQDAVGEVSVPVSLAAPDGRVFAGPDAGPLRGYGWQASVLGPFRLTAGEPPAAADEVVLGTALAERAGAQVGSRVTLVVGSEPAEYRVAGLARHDAGELTRQGVVFFPEEQVRELSGRPDQVDAIGVLAAAGTDPADLAARIRQEVPDVVTYLGDRRSDAETLDIGATRSFLIELSVSFGATMVLIVVIVVASTLALSVQQRRRELALLRAVGATPKQVLRMIGAEAALVSAAGALLGAIPGVALSAAVHSGLTRAGVLPEGFRLVVSPLPVLAAVLLCVTGARVGGWIAARRAAKVSPIEALGEAAVEPRRLGWFRLTLGLLLIPVALVAAVGLPVLLPGEAAVDGAASSALLLVIAVALLGPWVLRGAVAVLGPVLNRGRKASGFLATANGRTRSRRLSAATTPLIMGVTLAAAQVFVGSILATAAAQQADQGVVADYVVTSTSAGLSPELGEVLGEVSGAATVTPVVRTQTIIPFQSGDSHEFRQYATQGVEPADLASTMDLDVLDGELADLHDDTVALSRIAAGTVGAGVGDRVDLRLGDGTAVNPRVVAIYERGLGFGDVTLPYQVALRHTTDQLADYLLVAAEAEPAPVGEALRVATADRPTVVVADRKSFLDAAAGAETEDSAVSLILNAVLLGYLAIAVVNTLVMATVDRTREFALLRLVGTHRRQVLSMMRREARLIVVAAVVIGMLAALPALSGMSLALTGSPVPAISLLGFAGITAAAAIVAWPAIMISTRLALRARPVDAIATGNG